MAHESSKKKQRHKFKAGSLYLQKEAAAFDESFVDISTFLILTCLWLEAFTA